MPEVSLGRFELERETKTTVRYQRVNEDTGRTDTQYVPKAILPEPFPTHVLVVIRFD